jgi:hypothetical protein
LQVAGAGCGLRIRGKENERGMRFAAANQEPLIRGLPENPEISEEYHAGELE